MWPFFKRMILVLFSAWLAILPTEPVVFAIIFPKWPILISFSCVFKYWEMIFHIHISILLYLLIK